MEDKDKLIDRILKLKRQAESERKLLNEGTADLFLEKAEELMQKYSISASMLEVEEKSTNKVEIINELGITVIANPFLRSNARTNLRKQWFEKLGEIISSAYNCKVCPTDNGELKFYGYDYDREVAIFMFLRIAATANDKCAFWRSEERKNVGKAPLKVLFGKKETINYPKEWMGDEEFNDGFHFGFRVSLQENYNEHEVSEEVKKKREEVRQFYIKGNKTYYSFYEYDNSLEYLEEKNYNPIAVELGKKSGRAVSKQAKSNPSSLAITNEKLQNAESDIVYLLLDRSGSMGGFKLQQMKDGAIAFAKEAIGNNKAVGMVTFDTYVNHLIRPTKNIDEKFIDKINGIENGWSTDLTSALRAVKSYFTSRRNKRTICVVTDGMPDNVQTSLAVARDCKREGIKIIAIGVDGAKEEFLKELSSEEGLGLLVNKTELLLTMGEMGKRA